MFRLDTEDSKLTSVNARAEMHGEETMLACDLKFKVTMPNTALDMFDEGLRTTLFKRVDPKDADLADQGMADNDDYLPALRFPEMSKVNWGYEGAGYRMVISQGISGEEDVILINTKVDKFKFDCLQGGSVEIEFRVIGHPNETEMGRLCSLIQRDVDLTLEPPTPEQRAQMELDEMRGDDEEDDSEYDDAA